MTARRVAFSVTIAAYCSTLVDRGTPSIRPAGVGWPADRIELGAQCVVEGHQIERRPLRRQTLKRPKHTLVRVAVEVRGAQSGAVGPEIRHKVEGGQRPARSSSSTAALKTIVRSLSLPAVLRPKSSMTNTRSSGNSV